MNGQVHDVKVAHGVLQLELRSIQRIPDAREGDRAADFEGFREGAVGAGLENHRVGGNRGRAVGGDFGERHFDGEQGESPNPLAEKRASPVQLRRASGNSASEISTIKSSAILSRSCRIWAMSQDSGILRVARALKRVSPDMAALAHSV